MEFVSRRSNVYGTRGACASSQPLASEAGLQVLREGGNAADAAIAMAAALNVTEPCSTGLGGDCFVLYYNSREDRVHAVLGNGKAPTNLNATDIINKKALDMHGIDSVTIPGACAGWCDTIEKHGRLPMKAVLRPAIELAEGGFPVHEVAAHHWRNGSHLLKKDCNTHGGDMLINGEAPKAGDLFKNPKLGAVMRSIGEKGKDGFYRDFPSKAIVHLSEKLGGSHTIDDFHNHESTFPDPIKVNYHGVDIYEVPPPTQGIAALIALNSVENMNVEKMEHNSAEYLHCLAEATRMAFADMRAYVADPEKVSVPVKGLLDKGYARKRVEELFNKDRISPSIQHGTPLGGSETVYMCAVDGDGNACSMVNSNYMGFGTGLVPEGCGFTLQNRGYNFSLDPNHPNCIAAGKKPFHTIIPGMAVQNGNLYAAFGVMGGFMQPQGHLQVLVSMIDHGMTPQEALDAPRYCICDDDSGDAHASKGGARPGILALEKGIPQNTMDNLVSMGHKINPVEGHGRALFGRGQIIKRDPKTGVLCAGSDPRADGCAMAF